MSRPIPKRAHPIKRLLFDRRLHSRWLARLTGWRSIHQDVTETRIDRYPRLFAACRAMMGEDGAHDILSFGCSSGEEVVTLRDYFPNALIVGAEINRGQLAACRALPADRRTVFIHSARPNIAAHGPYDAIFCMAVLQRRPHAVEKRGLTNIARHYPFARFEDEISFLAGQLRAGGLLVVEHSQYRVEDIGAAVLLETVTEGTGLATGPRFDRAGELIAPQPVVGRIFRKRACDQPIAV